jgi:hypothetical protein
MAMGYTLNKVNRLAVLNVALMGQDFQELNSAEWGVGAVSLQKNRPCTKWGAVLHKLILPLGFKPALVKT